MIKLFGEEGLRSHIQESYAFRSVGVGFIVVYAGSLRIEVDGRRLPELRQDLLLLSAGKVYTLLGMSPDARLYIVSFDRKQMRQRINFSFNGYNTFRIMHGGSVLNKDVLELPPPKFGYLLELCRQLEFYLAERPGAAFSEEIVTGLSSVIGFSIADEIFAHLQQTQPRNLRKEQLTVQFFDLISQHFKEQKELKFYAAALCVSIKYLSNCVREVTSQPPSRFLAEALVNEAKEQLLTTSAPVYAVAADLDFSDQYAFGKFFKKHTGVSPLSFRKQNQRIDTI
ncbi:helix-turn-helix domain-containing protein [Hymenobacter aerophilus]|uniref:helix-turn-helix domain-containing protein n=1 Tax=Hymenobacter aerophilus TaxID=119644 RepID=UPI000382423D|nr:helix-turn-helix domain-containing protein [Hymenobacter aerophilus]